MCGITGIIKKNSGQNIDLAIQKMTLALQHRGPDACGFYFGKKVALGHRRLSIIDLTTAANQPIKDRTERYILVFNGEIYNYQHIRSQIGSYPFQSNSDTEVVLAAFIKWGEKCVSYFNGMFALAIWDTKNKALFVARDRLGIKPFYYYLDNTCFVFSSEMRAILASNLIEKRLSKEGMVNYLKFQTVHAPETIIKNVKQLEGGTIGWYKNGCFEKKRYWDIWQYGIEKIEINPLEAKKEVKNKFYESIENRLVSDVPYGAFLSGGIDSSIVVKTMSEISKNKINTFCIGFHQKKYDESKYANLIAKKYGTRHHQYTLKVSDFLETIPEILNAMDTPSADGPNSYIVSKFAKQHDVKVALSGLGGDELFAGYSVFKKFEQLISKRTFWDLPFNFRKAIAFPLQKLAFNNKQLKVVELLQQAKFSLATTYPTFRQLFTVQEIASILIEAPINSNLPHQFLLGKENFENLISNISIAEILTYTQNVLLRDTDQMSMASGLEVRVPFFDHNLIEYVLSLPTDIKRPSFPKSFLVESLAPELPKEITHRPKMGFTFPWDQWMRNQLAGVCKENIEWLAALSFFNTKNLLNFYYQFMAGDNRISWSRIWALTVLGYWMRNNEIKL